MLLLAAGPGAATASAAGPELLPPFHGQGVSLTIVPNPVACGQQVTVVAEFKNTGDAAWVPADVRAAWSAGFFASGIASLTKLTIRGSSAFFAFTFTAPATPGKYSVVVDLQYDDFRDADNGLARLTGDLFVQCGAIPTVASVSPNEGPVTGGTSVTVTGANLGGATSVQFGSLAALTAFTVNSAGTQITLTTPAVSAPATVDVTVTGPGGTSATSAADQFTFGPAPVVTGLAPSSGSSSGGTTVISGLNFTGATGVHFGTIPATVFSVNVGGQQISVVVPPRPTPGTVDVTVTTPFGTSSTSSADWYTYIG